ncbi:MAG: hypothetical protein AAB317_01260 [Nitrospirota bacterium]
MQDFTQKGNWLKQTSLEIRVIYTLFIVFALIGHLSFILISVYRIGVNPAEIANHYRGGADELSFPKEFIELLEVTHFHAYIEGIVLLVLTHLFSAVPLKRKTKLIAIVTAFSATFLDLSSPWLIRYVSEGFASLQILSWMGMAVSYFPLTLLPLYYLWKRAEAS